MPVNIRLAEYDPGWVTSYQWHAGRVRAALAEQVLLLEHVGSTSVPGLSAKPIIDIVLAVADSTEEPRYVPQLAGQGFILEIREPAWFEHRLFKATERDVNLHVFSQGCEEISRMLRFRDWLRTHAADRRLYEIEKRTLAARPWGRVQDYADAKSDVVRNILSRASGATH